LLECEAVGVRKISLPVPDHDRHLVNNVCKNFVAFHHLSERSIGSGCFVPYEAWFEHMQVSENILDTSVLSMQEVPGCWIGNFSADGPAPGLKNGSFLRPNRIHFRNLIIIIIWPSLV
jgi:hypothetical protein